MTHHGAALRRVTKDDELVRQLKEDFRQADLEPADRAMLEYAVKLARRPEEVEREDVEELRRQGFGDAAILDVAQVSAYYAYVNRLALGLGVERESYWGEEDLETPGTGSALRAAKGGSGGG